MQNTGKKTISRSFLTGLLIIVLIGFIASIGFSWMLQTRLSNENAAELLRINIKDVKQNILDASDKNLLELAHEVAGALDDGVNTSPERLAELMKQYDVSEIDLVNTDGIIVGCTNPDFVGFDMKSGEQSAEFMALADGTAKEVVQNYQPISYDASISRKYGGVAIDGGFLQVGYDAARFQKDVDRAMVGITHNWHVGRGGFVLISDRDRTIVSDPFRNEGKNLEITGLRIDTETMPEDQIFQQTVYDIPCSCLYGFSEGYLIVSVIPENEIVMQRDTSVTLSSALMIMIFIALFVMIYLLVRKLVVRNINRVNDSLSRITEGNLDEVVDVRSNTEFSSLSDDINATVGTLKQYIAAAASRIDEELAFAKNIQQSALPSVFPPYPDRKDFSLYASMDTAKEVGGDFYDVFYVDSTHLAFVIGDVSGKGVPAALFMASSKIVLQNCVRDVPELAEAVAAANNALCARNEAEMFVTIWVGVLDLESGELKFVSAGHNPAVLLRDGKPEYLRIRNGFVLGGMENMRYKVNTVSLSEGDMVYLYTDGVTEAEDAKHNLFGEDRLLECFEGKSESGTADMIDNVKKSVEIFINGNSQFDDMTMLCFKWK